MFIILFIQLAKNFLTPTNAESQVNHGLNIKADAIRMAHNINNSMDIHMTTVK